MTTQNWIAKADGFVPFLKSRSDDIEQARQLPNDIAERFCDEGFYMLMVPKAYGGTEIDPPTYFQLIERLAQGDASAAWCVMIGSTTGLLSAYMPQDVARDMFAPENRTITAGVFAPKGKAVQEGDGYRVSGQWQWGSGSHNAKWIAGGCMVLEDGKPKRMANGMPVSRMMMAPKKDIEMLDTWHVSGLCGSGSTDFAMKDLYIPESHAISLVEDKPVDRPLYTFPVFALLATGVSAVALGIGRAAIDELISFASEKTPQGAMKPLASRQETQGTIAEAEAKLRSARGWLFDVLSQAWETTQATGTMTLEQRRDIRNAASFGARTAAEVVTAAYHLGGGTSVYKKSPLQRHFRDVHVTTQHMMVGRPVMEQAGRLYMGMETDISTF